MPSPERCAHCGLTGRAAAAATIGERWYCCVGCRLVAGLLGTDAAPGPAPVSADTPVETAELAIGGMWCGSCAVAIEAVWRRMPGIRDVQVSFATELAYVSWDPEITSRALLAGPVCRLGYRVAPLGDGVPAGQQGEAESRSLQIRTAIAVFFSNFVMMVAVALYGSVGPDSTTAWWLALVSGVLAIPVVFGAGWPFFRAGWRTLRAGVPGMDVLVATGALAAFAHSAVALATGSTVVFFDTAAMIVTFLLVGRLVELQARRRGTAAVRQLLRLAPDVARLVTGPGETVETPVTAVAIGALVSVRPGERVPVDGIVTEGRSQADRALLTGETRPVRLAPGSPVAAGSLNGAGALLVRVTRGPGEREVDRVAQAMRRLLSRRTPLDRVVDRLMRWFVPAVSLLATGTGLATGLIGGSAGLGLTRAIAVVIIACPCALGLAAPLAVLTAAGAAARRGVFFRDGESIERLAAVEAVLFDKTGTLTSGEPHLLAVEPAPGRSVESVLQLAALAERDSEHPLARAIRAAGGPLPGRTGETTAHPGDGVSWQADGHGPVLVGRAGFLTGRGIAVGSASATAGSQVHVADDGVWLGMLAIGDRLRPEVPAIVAALRRMGLGLAMLTGDTAAAAAPIARQAGLQTAEVHADLRPLDKLAMLEGAGRAAFVGDGLNDGPALAAAMAAVTVGEATDVALSVAHVVLRSGGLTHLPWAIVQARRTRRVIRQNLAWAIAYNALALPLAIAGVATPLMAAAAMALSSLSVVLNSLRLAGGGEAGRQLPFPARAVETTPR